MVDQNGTDTTGVNKSLLNQMHEVEWMSKCVSSKKNILQTLSSMVSITSSDKFMSDSDNRAWSISFTCTPNHPLKSVTIHLLMHLCWKLSPSTLASHNNLTVGVASLFS
jgi:hypothetical protein